MPFDVPLLRRHFPALGQTIGGHPLIYLDNAATTQKPQAVLDAMDRFYREENANVHRGMHVLAERATDAYEGARKTVQDFLRAKHADEIVFTHGTTEALNVVARGAGLGFGDAVVLTMLEHHSNIVPWLQLKQERGVEVRWVDIDDQGQLRMEQLEEHLRDGKVKIVSVTGLSNVLGVLTPLEEIIHLAHRHGAKVCVDAAQLVAHQAIDAQRLDCDFLAWSGHKLYGPTGIGVLYGKREWLRTMPPMMGGGMMIKEVTMEGFTAADAPAKFEAGTPSIAEAVGLAAAIKWFTALPSADREAHEQRLLEHAARTLSALPGLNILGPAKHHGCLSFTVEGIHPHDLTDVLGAEGICLRAGHHCTQPLHRRLGISASTRLSVAVYNTLEEIDAVVPAIEKVRSMLMK